MLSPGSMRKGSVPGLAGLPLMVMFARAARTAAGVAWVKWISGDEASIPVRAMVLFSRPA